jgi:hypothetical protein
MQRRTFLRVSFSTAGLAALAACAGEAIDPAPSADAGPDDPDAAAPPGGDGGAPATDAAACTRTTTLHDTYAVALYFDGTLGPTTGTIRVADVVAGVTLPMLFWHGHGGQQHRFTVLPAHFAALRQGQRVMIETTMVDDHSHQLFIDPVDPRWRVPGAPPVQVPAC